MSEPDCWTRRGWVLLQAGMVLVIAAMPISIALMNVGLAMAWCGALVARAPVHRTVGFWWGVAFVAWQLISRAVAWTQGRDGGGGFGMAYTWTGLCLAQLAFAAARPGAAIARAWAWRLLSLATVVACVVAVGQFVIGHRGSATPFRIHPDGVRFQEATGLYAIHLTLGVIMMLLLTAVGGGAFRTWSAPGPWSRLTAVAATVAMVLSFGRLALVGVVAGAFAGIAARGRRSLLAATAVALLVGGLGLGVLAVAQPQRFQATLRGEDGRWPIWNTAITLVADHPWVGLGSGRQFRVAYRERFAQVNPGCISEFPDGAPHAHNTPLSMATEHGLPVVALWLALLGAVLVGVWRTSAHGHGRARSTAAAVVAAYVTAGLFQSLASGGEPCHALWTLLGCCLASCPDHDTA